MDGRPVCAFGLCPRGEAESSGMMSRGGEGPIIPMNSFYAQTSEVRQCHALELRWLNVESIQGGDALCRKIEGQADRFVTSILSTANATEQR